MTQTKLPGAIAIAAVALATSIALAACGVTAQPDPGAGELAVPPGGAGPAVHGPWEAARLRGATFRAIGQEPGWSLDIHPDRLRYVGDYGSTLVDTPAPEPDRVDSSTIVYDARTEAHTLRVTTREARCVDTMSGIEFPHVVAVVVDGRVLQGCGQPLGAGTIDGIEWRLVALGGAPVVAGGPDARPHLRFNVESPEVTGSTGCNRLRASLERDGDSLRFGPLATTRMACVDPALARQEQEFVRALERVDRFSRDGDELILHAGATAVARFIAERADI